MEEQRDDRSVDEAAAISRLYALEAAAGAPRSKTAGQPGGAFLGGEAAGLTAAGTSVGDRGAAKAREGLPRERPDRRLLADIAGGATHGGDYQRGGRCGPPGLVEMSQVRREARILEPLAVEPASELSEGGGVDPARVR